MNEFHFDEWNNKTTPRIAFDDPPNGTAHQFADDLIVCLLSKSTDSALIARSSVSTTGANITFFSNGYIFRCTASFSKIIIYYTERDKICQQAPPLSLALWLAACRPEDTVRVVSWCLCLYKRRTCCVLQIRLCQHTQLISEKARERTSPSDRDTTLLQKSTTNSLAAQSRSTHQFLTSSKLG